MGQNQCEKDLWCGGVPVKCREKGKEGDYCPLNSDMCKGPTIRKATDAEIANAKALYEKGKNNPIFKFIGDRFKPIVDTGMIPEPGYFCDADSKCRVKRGKGGFCLLGQNHWCISGKCGWDSKCE